MELILKQSQGQQSRVVLFFFVGFLIVESLIFFGYAIKSNSSDYVYFNNGYAQAVWEFYGSSLPLILSVLYFIPATLLIFLKETWGNIKLITMLLWLTLKGISYIHLTNEFTYINSGTWYDTTAERMISFFGANITTIIIGGIIAVIASIIFYRKRERSG